MENKGFVFFLLVLFAYFPVFGQDSLEERLFMAGFEQVKVIDSGDTLSVYYEHRSFRNPRQSIELAKKVIGGIDDRILVFIPLYHNVPVAKYIGDDLIYAPLDLKAKKILKESLDLSRGYRFHVRISPDFSARFGKFDDPFQNKTNVILDTRIYILTGLSLHTGVLLPLHNNLDVQEKNIRLAPSHLHFFRSISNHHFFSLKGGLFFFDRYGLDFQYRYMPFGRNFNLGIESSVTGFYFLPRQGIYMEGLDDFSFLLEAEYRLPFVPGVSLGFSVGQFLFQDRGFRVDFIRQYGNVDFGLFAAMTQNGRNVGFQFALPLFPGKILRTGKFELRSAEEFRWEYSYNNEDVVARRYRLGTPRLKDVLRQYHPGFIRK